MKERSTAPIRPLTFWLVVFMLLLAAQVMLKGQVPSGYQQVPDCQGAFYLTALNQNSVQLNNTQVGCTTWAVQYSTLATGGGPAISLEFQQALDNNGAPLVWGAYMGTTLTGANPLVTLGGYQALFNGYAPWVRVRVTGINDVTVRGVIYGWKAKPQASTGVAAVVDVNNFPANQAVTVTNPILSVNLGDTPNIDAFSRLRVSEAETVFESQQEYLLNSLLWNTVTASGGTTAYIPAESATALTTDGSANSRALVQTRGYFRYQPGKSQLVLMTGVFGNAEFGNVHRAGLFDDNNGLFLEITQIGGVDVGAVVQQSDTSGAPVDTSVTQALWNIDPMDGSGPSGVTIDWAHTQILVIDFQWLGVGRVRIGFDVGGVIYPVHQFLNANVQHEVYMRTPNLPLRYENLDSAKGAGGPSTMETICSTVMSEGGLEANTGVSRSASSAGTQYVVNTTRLPIVCIRPALLFQGKTNRAKIVIESVTAMSSGNTSWSLQYYAIPVAGVFVNAGNSIVETDAASVAGTTRSTTIGAGGVRVLDGFLPGSGNGDRAAVGVAISNYLPITLDFTGATQDYVCLCAQSLAGNVNVSGAINWREIY